MDPARNDVLPSKMGAGESLVMIGEEDISGR
jgi:hypothetical protein